MLAAFGDPAGEETPVFNSDQFNEMEPNNGSLAYVSAANSANYAAMAEADPRAIYLMQGWLFHEGYWTQERITAYLSAPPQDKFLVLDLNTEAGPTFQSYPKTTRWLWNALLVYGGRRGVYGSLNTVTSSPYADLAANANMVGLGITPEAIDQDMRDFDAFWEAAWRPQAPNATAWLQNYAVRRYGAASPSVSAAYAILEGAAFNSDIDTAALEERPALGARMSQNTNATGILEATRLMVAAAMNGEVPSPDAPGPFSYDLTDFTRQVLVNTHSDVNAVLSGRFTAALASGNLVASHAEITALVAYMDGLIVDLDALLAADANFLLGFWLNASRAWADAGTPGEAELLGFNALNQITSWGPSLQINDYAAKNGWSGLVSGYYRARWALFGTYLVNATVTGAPPDWDAFATAANALEEGWGGANALADFPTSASGAKPSALAAAALSKYAPPTPGAGWTAVPDTDAANPPPGPWPAVWSKLGDNVVAIGNDCPFLVHVSAARERGSLRHRPLALFTPLPHCRAPSTLSLRARPRAWRRRAATSSTSRRRSRRRAR